MHYFHFAVIKRKLVCIKKKLSEDKWHLEFCGRTDNRDNFLHAFSLIPFLGCLSQI